MPSIRQKDKNKQTKNQKYIKQNDKKQKDKKQKDKKKIRFNADLACNSPVSTEVYHRLDMDIG